MKCFYSNTVAIKYGINAALIAGYIREKLSFTKCYIHGEPYERITIKNMTGHFPFMGEKAVRNAIKRLKRANILVSKQYGKPKFDHANYYSITAHGREVMNGDE